MSGIQSPNSSKQLIAGNKISAIYLLSILLLAATGLISVFGLVWTGNIYPTLELAETFRTNDLVYLITCVPGLLVSIWLAKRNKLIGLLYWLGALLAIIYNYLVYLFSFSPGIFSLIYFLIIGLSLYILISLITKMERTTISSLLNGKIKERLSGGTLCVFGLAFLFRAINILINGLITGDQLPVTEIALNLSDLVLSITWIIFGWLLWIKKPLGYTLGLGLLFQAFILFIGLLVFLVVQPILIGAHFSMIDFVVVLVMTLISSIPFILFSRAVYRI